jgi:zinc protease
VVSQWKALFTRDRLVIGLIGKQATTALADRVAAGLASLPRQGAPLAFLPEPTDDGVKALLVEKTTDSTAMSLGYTYGVLRSDPDFAALWVGNSALGEHRQLGGILFHELREVRGLNYGDYTYLEHFVQGDDTYPEPNRDRHLQDFSVWIRPVVNENRGFALRAALFEIGKVVKEGLTAEQVERTKAFLKSYTLAWQAADGRRLGYAIDDLFYGTPGFLAGFRDKLPSITVDQVNAALRAHVDPANLRFAIVTQHAKAFRDELLSGAPSAIKYDSPKPPEVLAEDKQIDGLKLPLTEADTRLIDTNQLFEARALGFKPSSAPASVPAPAAPRDPGALRSGAGSTSPIGSSRGAMPDAGAQGR